jgi:hypothetical protein
MAVIYSKERINYLSGQVAGMFSGGISLGQLGNVALEVMVAKENAEEIIEGKYSEQEKKTAQVTIEQLREIEKNIVRLYVFATLERPQNKKGVFLDYLARKYSPPYKP